MHCYCEMVIGAIGDQTMDGRVCHVPKKAAAYFAKVPK
jgi:hypothetical protein